MGILLDALFAPCEEQRGPTQPSTDDGRVGRLELMLPGGERRVIARCSDAVTT